MSKGNRGGALPLEFFYGYLLLKKFRPWADASCRHCGEEIETGFHAGIVCGRGEWLGRRWSCWKEIDDREKWAKKEKDGDKKYTVDLVKEFFYKLDL